MSVVRSKLQLVGASSMFLAAKFEEIYPPEVGDFVYITDDTYTKLQVHVWYRVIIGMLPEIATTTSYVKTDQGTQLSI